MKALVTTELRVPQSNRSVKIAIANVLLAVLIAVPAITMFWFVVHFGVNVPYMDEWGFSELVVKSLNGQLQLSDLLLAQNNEHMLAVPYSLMLAVSLATRYNSVALMLVSAVIICVTDALWCFIVWQSIKSKYGTTKTLMSLILISSLTCSLRQYENLLWGYQVQMTLLPCLMLLTLIFLEKFQTFDRFFGLAVLTAVLSTYCFANGLVIWPAGVFLCLLRIRQKSESNKPLRTRLTGVWLAIGIAVAVVYMISRSATPEAYSQHASLNMLLHRPKAIILYLLALWGSPISPQHNFAILSGLLTTLLCISVFVWRPAQSERETQMIPLLVSVLFFTAVSGLLICAGRAANCFGIDQALCPRYCTMITPGLISLYLLTVIGTDPGGFWRWARLAATTVAIVSGLLFSIGDTFAQATATRLARTVFSDTLRTYQYEGDGRLSRLFPDMGTIKRITPELERHKLNLFARN